MSKKIRRDRYERRDRAVATAGERPWPYYLIYVLAGTALFTPMLPASALGGPVMLKGAVFQLCALMAAAVWFVLAVYDRRYRPNLKNPLVLAAIAWAVFLIISLFFSLNPSLSFWSNRDRVSGVLANIIWVLWLVTLGSTFRSWKEWRPLLMLTTAVAVMVGTFGLLQLADHPEGFRIESSLGNAIYLADYILPHFFISLILLFRSRNWFSRLLYAATDVIYLIVIYHTSTRGVVVALALGMTAAILGYLFLLAENRRRALIAGFSALIALGLLTGCFCWLAFSQSGAAWGVKHVPPTVYSIIYRNNGSDRLSLWRMGLEGWKERPWMGRGLENYAVVFDRYVEVTKDSSLSQNWYDRSHNQFVDILIGCGAIGLAFYLAFWSAAMFVIIRGVLRSRRASAAARQSAISEESHRGRTARQAAEDSLRSAEEDRRNRLTLWLLAPLLIAQATAVFFAFETVSATMVTWMMLGMAVGLTSTAPFGGGNSAGVDNGSGSGGVNAAVGSSRRDQNNSDGTPAVDVPVIVFMLAVAAITGWWIGLRPYNQAAVYNKVMADVRREPAKVAERLEKVLSKQTFILHDIRYNLLSRIRTYSENELIGRDVFRPVIEVASAQMQKTMASRPDDFKTLLATSYIMREEGFYNHDVLPKAQEVSAQSIALAPNRPEGYEEMAEILLSMGDLDGAWAQLETALTKSRHDLSTGRIRMRRAGVQAMRGDMDGAEAEIAVAASLNYDIGSDPREMATFAEKMKNGEPRPQIMKYYERLSARQPEHPLVLAAYIVAANKTHDQATMKEKLGVLEKVDPASAKGIKESLGLNTSP